MICHNASPCLCTLTIHDSYFLTVKIANVKHVMIENIEITGSSLRGSSRQLDSLIGCFGHTSLLGVNSLIC